MLARRVSGEARRGGCAPAGRQAIDDPFVAPRPEESRRRVAMYVEGERRDSVRHPSLASGFPPDGRLGRARQAFQRVEAARPETGRPADAAVRSVDEVLGSGLPVGPEHVGDAHPREHGLAFARRPSGPEHEDLGPPRHERRGP